MFNLELCAVFTSKDMIMGHHEQSKYLQYVLQSKPVIVRVLIIYSFIFDQIITCCVEGSRYNRCI